MIAVGSNIASTFDASVERSPGEFEASGECFVCLSWLVVFLSMVCCIVCEGHFIAPTNQECERGSFFTFSREFNCMLVRGPGADPFMLYMREENIKLANKLDEFVNSTKDRLFTVQGPPGVGKTKETLAWILNRLTNHPAEVFAWIKLTAKTSPTITHAVYVMRKSSNSESENLVDYQRFRIGGGSLVSALRRLNVDVVIFDNCTQQNNIPAFECLVALKTIMVSSLQLKSNSDIPCKSWHVMNGWTLEEYQAACRNNAFYDSVKENLSTDSLDPVADLENMSDEDKRNEIIAKKFYVAGSSARWMFELSTEILLHEQPFGDSIQSHLVHATIEQLKSGCINDDCSNTSVNHLLTRIKGRATIVSQYVANALVARHGEQLLKFARKLNGTNGENNPSLDGILMEMEFIFQLGKSRAGAKKVIELYDENKKVAIRLESGKNVIKYVKKDFPSASFTVKKGDWMVPSSFSNGGFDCVQYKKNELLFVQITRSITHSFNLNYYQQFRVMFEDKFAFAKINKCSVWFVVREEVVGEFSPKERVGNLKDFEKFEVGAFKRIEP